MAASASHRASQAGGRGPAIAHTVLLVVAVALVATVALVVRPPSPPSVAEFAPRAVKQIKDAPQNQVSQFGDGGGACVEGVVCEGPGGGEPGAGGGAASSTVATADPEADVIDVARVRQCFGSPPRQIEDPQSPPCVPYWKGDNGGATSKGVTATTITVAWPSTIPSQPHLEDMVEFFNRRFELYGRKIDFKPTGIEAGFGEPLGPAQMQATAVKIDKELQAFASLGFYEYGAYGQSSYYYDELARRRIVSVSGDDGFRTERENYDHRDHEGFQWSYVPTVDELERNLGLWVCGSLAGKPPIHAGQPYYPGTPVQPAQPRRFGVIQQTRNGRAVDIEPLLDTLGGCGVRPEVHQLEAQGGDPAQQGALAKLNSEKRVSSIICICDIQPFKGLHANAARAGYQPEWLIYGSQNHVSDANAGGSGLAQVDRTFGINGTNKSNPLTQEPWFWAVKAQNPSADASRENGPTLGDPLYYPKFYHEVLLLASGLQLAGPNLTPETFRDGLMMARFPNPGAGGPPFFQAAVGFGPGDHSMVRDVALGWFDRSRRSDFTGSLGTFCSVGRGLRFGPATWRSVPAEQFHPATTPPGVPCK